MRIDVRVISKGYAEGEAIVSKKPVSFYGDVDPTTGIIKDEKSDIYGESISGKIFIFPTGRGSTVGSYILLNLKKSKAAPLAIVNVKTDAIIAVGAIIAEIPLVDKPSADLMNLVKTGDYVRIFAQNEGWIEID